MIAVDDEMLFALYFTKKQTKGPQIVLQEGRTVHAIIKKIVHL